MSGKELKAEELLSVAARNLKSVRFADCSMVEPLRCLDYIFERVVD
jgi:hypothetical protein